MKRCNVCREPKHPTSNAAKESAKTWCDQMQLAVMAVMYIQMHILSQVLYKRMFQRMFHVDRASAIMGARTRLPCHQYATQFSTRPVSCMYRFYQKKRASCWPRFWKEWGHNDLLVEYRARWIRWFKKRGKRETIIPWDTPYNVETIIASKTWNNHCVKDALDSTKRRVYQVNVILS